MVNTKALGSGMHKSFFRPLISENLPPLRLRVLTVHGCKALGLGLGPKAALRPSASHRVFTANNAGLWKVTISACGKWCATARARIRGRLNPSALV